MNKLPMPPGCTFQCADIPNPEPLWSDVSDTSHVETVISALSQIKDILIISDNSWSNKGVALGEWPGDSCNHCSAPGEIADCKLLNDEEKTFLISKEYAISKPINLLNLLKHWHLPWWAHYMVKYITHIFKINLKKSFFVNKRKTFVELLYHN